MTTARRSTPSCVPCLSESSRVQCELWRIAIACAAALLFALAFRLGRTLDPLQWWVPIALVGGVALADFSSGVLHWVADTWGRADLPFIGPRILVPFRVHHLNPDDFLRRSFLDTNGDVAVLSLAPLAALFWVPLDDASGQALAVAGFGFCAMGALTNQIHQWAHMPAPPGPVVFLHSVGLLLRPRDHARHHGRPFDGDYCITTGWCNRPLDAIGFFRGLERTVSRVTGAAPRHDEQLPPRDWQAKDATVGAMSEQRGAERLKPHVALHTSEATSLGHGFISGLTSALLGIAGLGLVLGLRFPGYVQFGELRPLYDSPHLRAGIHVTLVASFVLGTVSAFLRANKALALTGIGFTLVAALLGGSRVGDAGAVGARSSWLAVDFFVLNLLLYAAVFVPLERLFALKADQGVFRRHWLVDLSYFFVNSLLVEVLTVLTLTPALVLFDWARVDAIAARVGTLPLPVQVLAMVLVADLAQYWVHRTFHVVPFLWPFHAIHHSVEEMDWLAGSRLHLVDVIVTRGLTYLPIFVLGFSRPALVVYVFLVAAQATFIHANVGWEFRPLRRLVATPAFHHWHHSSEQEALDKNFSVHTPLWDILFGTYYLPNHWPVRYGLNKERHLPVGWLRQLLYPFVRRRH